jgi:hypothetical protein
VLYADAAVHRTRSQIAVPLVQELDCLRRLLAYVEQRRTELTAQRQRRRAAVAATLQVKLRGQVAAIEADLAERLRSI